MIKQKYVPPHKRNQKSELPPPTEVPKRQTAVGFAGLNEDDFKPLVRDSVIKQRVLTNWKDIVNEPAPVMQEKRKTKYMQPKSSPLRNQVSYDNFEEDKYYQDEEPILQPQPTDDDGWTAVEKKKKVYPKRDKIQEAMDNGDAPLSESESDNDFFNDEEEEYQKYFD